MGERRLEHADGRERIDEEEINECPVGEITQRPEGHDARGDHDTVEAAVGGKRSRYRMDRRARLSQVASHHCRVEAKRL